MNIVSKHWLIIALGLVMVPALYAKTVTFINTTGTELKVEFVGIDRYNVDRRWRHIRYVPASKNLEPFVIKTHDMKESGFKNLSYTIDGFRVSITYTSPYTNSLILASKLFRLDNHAVYKVALVAGECVVTIVPQGWIAPWYIRTFAPHLLVPTEYPLGKREFVDRL